MAKSFVYYLQFFSVQVVRKVKQKSSISYIALFLYFTFFGLVLHALSSDCCGQHQCMREIPPCGKRMCLIPFCPVSKTTNTTFACDCELGQKWNCNGQCVAEAKCDKGKCATTMTPVSSISCVPKNCTA